jgi:hypothetical protein
MSEVGYRLAEVPPTLAQKPPSGSRYNHNFGELGIVMSKLVSFLVYGREELDIPFERRALQGGLLCRGSSHQYETRRFGQVAVESRIDLFLVKTMLASKTVFQAHSVYPQEF